MKFSKKSLKPPIDKSKKAQLIKPVKLSNPEFQLNKESLGRWHLKSHKNISIQCVLLIQ